MASFSMRERYLHGLLSRKFAACAPAPGHLRFLAVACDWRAAHRAMAAQEQAHKCCSTPLALKVFAQDSAFPGQLLQE